MKKTNRSKASPAIEPVPIEAKWYPHSWCFSGIVIAVLALYAWTCARTVTMEDSGEFLLSAYRMGIAHPPGYPVFILLGKLFSNLPFGTVAWRIHLVSSTASALSCAFLYLLTFRFTRHQAAAVFAALALAFSRTFWSQSVIAEVYALNCVLFLMIFWIGLELQDRFRAPLFWMAGLLFGLALSNSWPLIILESGAFALLLWPFRSHLLKHFVPFCVAVLVGLLPYGVLVWRSHYGGDIFFINPVRDFDELWAYVARNTYANENVQPTWTLVETFKFIAYFFWMLIREFGWAASPLIGIGAVVSWTRFPRLGSLALWMAFLSSPLFLLFSWRAEFNELTRIVYSVFHLVPFAVAALWMAAGLVWLHRYKPFQPYHGALVWAGLVLLSALGLNYQENNLRHDSFAQDFAEITLKRLPPNSILFVWGDADTGPFAYTSLIERFRPDVTVTSQMGVIFPEHVFDRDYHRTDQQRAAQLNSYVRKKIEAGVPVFSTRKLVYPDATRTFPYLYVNRGPVEQIVTTPTPTVFDGQMIADAKAFLDKILDGTYKNHWPYHRQILTRRFCVVLALANVDHPLLHQNADCKMALVQRAAEIDHNYRWAAQLLREVLRDSPLLPLQDKAEIERLLFVNLINATNAAGLGPAEKLAGYQQAVDEIYPFTEVYTTCFNSAATALLEVRSQVAVNLDIQAMAQTFGRCPPHRKLLEQILKQPPK